MQVSGGRGRRRRLMGEINIVPYIDVMLVLLIIFMVTAPLMTQGVKVDLPKVASKTLPPDKQLPIVLTVTQTGEYFVNVGPHPKQALSKEEVQSTIQPLLQKDPGRKVYVRGDQKADYGTVVKAMILLQQTGAETVGLITDIKDHDEHA